MKLSRNKINIKLTSYYNCCKWSLWILNSVCSAGAYKQLISPDGSYDDIRVLVAGLIYFCISQCTNYGEGRGEGSLLQLDKLQVLVSVLVCIYRSRFVMLLQHKMSTPRNLFLCSVLIIPEVSHYCVMFS